MGKRNYFAETVKEIRRNVLKIKNAFAEKKRRMAVEKEQEAGTGTKKNRWEDFLKKIKEAEAKRKVRVQNEKKRVAARKERERTAKKEYVQKLKAGIPIKKKSPPKAKENAAAKRKPKTRENMIARKYTPKAKESASVTRKYTPKAKKNHTKQAKSGLRIRLPFKNFSARRVKSALLRYAKIIDDALEKAADFWGTIPPERRAACLFFAAVVLKYILYGYQYYPVLDDFIQYGGYPLYHDLSHVYFEIGTMATRPFASLLDPLLWGSMWSCMGVALAIITLMHFFAVYFIERTLSRCGYSVGPMFWIAALFLPIGSEGAYWISASSRVVVGLFFSAGSLWILTQYLQKRKRYFLILFIIFYLLSYGFYEAVSIFSFLGAYLVLLAQWKNSKDQNWMASKTKKWLLALPAIFLVLMLVYYIIGSNIGAMGSRAEGFTFKGFFGKLCDGGAQAMLIFTKELARLMTKGFWSGLWLVWMRGIWGALWLGFLLLICAGLYHTDVHKTPEERTDYTLLFVGLLLFLAPLMPNMLMAIVWLPYRNIFVPLIGLALILEWLLHRYVRRKTIKGAVYAALLLICLVSWMNEYDTYRRVSEMDIRLSQNVAEKLDDDVLAGKKDVVVIMKQPVKITQTKLYKDRGKSVFDADWSLTGAIRAVTGNMNIRWITPAIGWYWDTDGAQVLYMARDGSVTREKNEDKRSVRDEISGRQN